MGKVYLLDHVAPTFHPVVQDIFRNKHQQYWLNGGRGSAKSSCAGLTIPVGIMQDPSANAIIYRKAENTLYDSVYAQIVWALDKLGVLHLWQLGKSPMQITYKPTGQKILFRGADDPARSKSIKLQKGYFKYIWFEEPTEFNGMEEIRTILQSLIRGGGPVVCLLTYNPPITNANWVNEEAARPRADRLVHSSTYLDVPPDWLGEAFLLEAEALRQTNERAYRHEYLGEITGTGGQVFDNLKLRTITDDEISTFGRMYVGLDFGFAVDPAAMVSAFYLPSKRELYITDEYYAVGASYDKLAEEAGRASAKSGTIIADSAEPRSIAELSARGLRIAGAKKGPGSVEHGIRWLQNLGAIVIDPARCPEAAREFAGYEYERTRNGGFRADYPDKNNHTIDAVRYALEPVIGRKKARTLARSLPI